MLLVLAGVLMSLTFFVMMGRINMRRFLGYATLIDIVFTILIFWIFAHTFSGAVAGAVAGLCMAVGLSLLRRIIGYDRLCWSKWKLHWVHTPPVWTVRKVILTVLKPI